MPIKVEPVWIFSHDARISRVCQQVILLSNVSAEECQKWGRKICFDIKKAGNQEPEIKNP